MKTAFGVLLAVASVLGSHAALRGANEGKLVGAKAPAISLSSGSYDTSEALQMAYLSSAAYCSSSVLTDWSCGTACSSVSISGDVLMAEYSPDDLQAYVTTLANGDGAVVFRGTQGADLKNWILNLNISTPEPYDVCPSCKVEGGFLTGWRALEPQILSNLNQLGFGSGSTIHVTGHSLGAAMAALASYELTLKGFNVATVYTFGQPRVGDKAYAQLYEGQMGNTGAYRVVHHDDPVPHLPPEWTGFWHITEEVWYNEDNTSYQMCTEGSGEDPHCSDSVPWYDLLDIDDHLYYMGIKIDGATCTA